MTDTETKTETPAPAEAKEEVPAAAEATPAPAEGAENTENKTEEKPSEEKKEEGEEKKEEAAATEEKKEEEKKEEKEFVMTGRVFIVTGASSGLGYEVARYLCEGGNDVILACRNEEKANRAIERIKQKNPNALATYLNLDLASTESIRKFVDEFRALEKPLHVLINNAGVMLSPKDPRRQFTTEGFELTIGTNHLGPYLLTNLLLDDLRKSADGESPDCRVINVTSSWHDPESKRRNREFRDLQPLDVDNLLLFAEGSYTGLQAYKNSKAANVMFTYELARRLEGSGVTALAVDPGFVPSTELLRNASGMSKFLNRYIMHGMLRFAKLTRTIAQGGAAIVTAATDDKFKGVSGKYIVNGAEAESSAETRDEEKQKKLWELSGGYTRLDGYEVVEVPEPPKEEEKPKKEKKEKEEKKKEEKKEEGKAEDGEAKAAEGEDGEKKEGEEKKDEEKQETPETEAATEATETPTKKEKKSFLPFKRFQLRGSKNKSKDKDEEKKEEKKDEEEKKEEAKEEVKEEKTVEESEKKEEPAAEEKKE